MYKHTSPNPNDDEENKNNRWTPPTGINMPMNMPVPNLPRREFNSPMPNPSQLPKYDGGLNSNPLVSEGPNLASEFSMSPPQANNGFETKKGGYNPGNGLRRSNSPNKSKLNGPRPMPDSSSVNAGLNPNIPTIGFNFKTHNHSNSFNPSASSVNNYGSEPFTSMPIPSNHMPSSTNNHTLSNMPSTDPNYLTMPVPLTGLRRGEHVRNHSGQPTKEPPRNRFGHAKKNTYSFSDAKAHPTSISLPEVPRIKTDNLNETNKSSKSGNDFFTSPVSSKPQSPNFSPKASAPTSPPYSTTVSDSAIPTLQNLSLNDSNSSKSPPLSKSNSRTRERDNFDFVKFDFHKLSPRGLVLYRFLEKEAKFSRILNFIERVIIRRVNESPIFEAELKAEAIDALICNLPELLTSHHKFLKDLADRLTQEIEAKRFKRSLSNAMLYGDIFLKHLEHLQSFKEFSQRYLSIKEYIITAQVNSSKFKLWLHDIEKSKALNSHSILDYFSSIQFHLDPHIPFLEEVMQLTDDSNNDKAMLTLILDTYRETLKDLELIRQANFHEDSKLMSPTESEVNEVQPVPEVPPPLNVEADNWASAVPPEVLQATDVEEVKRQEALFELLKSERDYVQDLLFVKEMYIDGIAKSGLFPPDKQELIIHNFVYNFLDFVNLHVPLVKALNQRQLESAILDKVGDLLLPWSQRLFPYGSYGSRVGFGLDNLNKFKSENLQFLNFVKEIENHPKARKLNMNSFLSTPTRRLARYPLLLEAVLKRTKETHPDHKLVTEVKHYLHLELTKIDQIKGSTDTKLRLKKIADRLDVPSHFYSGGTSILNQLDLENEHRVLLKENTLKLAKGHQPLRIFLFDHVLLITKEKVLEKEIVEYEVFRKPIALTSIMITAQVTQAMVQSAQSGGFFDMFSSSSNTANPNLCFTIHSKDTLDSLMLVANTQLDKNQWVTAIQDQMKVAIEKNSN